VLSLIISACLRNSEHAGVDDQICVALFVPFIGERQAQQIAL
jgi:hypothetical protein